MKRELEESKNGADGQPKTKYSDLVYLSNLKKMNLMKMKNMTL